VKDTLAGFNQIMLFYKIGLRPSADVFLPREFAGIFKIIPRLKIALRFEH
jgi:hypothetical protein